MLLERAADLTAKIAQYQKLKGASDQSDQFNTRATQLANAALRITRVRLELGKLAEAGISVGFKPNDAKGYAAKAQALRAALKVDPSAIHNPPFDLKHEFVDRLVGIATAADQAMTAAWKAYLSGRAPFGSDNVLSALSAVPQFRVSVAKIRKCRTEIAAFANGVPTDPSAAVVRIDSLISEHDAAWSELAADDIPPSIVSFLRAAAAEGVPLKTYTAEIQTWLGERSLLNAFHIRLG